MIRFTCLLLGLISSMVSVAQNDFRSRQSGDWNQSATWEEFISGSWQVTSNTPDFNSGTIVVQNPHVVTVTASVTIDQTTVQSGGTLIVNDAVIVTLNNGTGNDFTSAGTTRLLAESFLDGSGNIVLSGTLRAGSLNATGAISTGTTVGNLRNSGSRTFSIGSRVVYDGTSAQIIGSGHPGNAAPAGIFSEIDNANGVSFDPSAGSNFTGGGTLYFPGDLILTQGNLNIISIIGVTRTLVLTGGITSNSNFITLAGPQTNISITGSGDMTFPSPPGVQSVGNLTIGRPMNSISFPSEFHIQTRLTVSGNAIFSGTGNTVRDLVLNSGSIDFNGSAIVTGPVTMANATTIFFEGTTMTLGANFVSAGGVLSSDASSVLSLTGSVPHTSPLEFVGGSALNTLSLNKLTVGTSATINSSVNVVNALNLTTGTLDIVGSSLSLSSGATITKADLASIINSSPSGGPWNLIYTGASQSTGLEIPASGILNSLTISTFSSTTITLTKDIAVANALSIPSNSRTFTSGSNNVTVGTLSNSGIFNAPTNVASTGLTVSGNFVNNSTFNHNNGTVIISGACVMSGTQINTTNFNAITIGAGGSLTAPTTLNIRSNFINNGTFTSGAGTVVFNGGSSTLSGSSMATTSFANVTVNSGATLVPSSNLTLTGNLVMNGNFTAGAGTTTFNGTSSLTGTNISTTTFNNIQVNATRSLTASNIILILTGNFTNDGSFNPGTTGTMNFAGSSIIAGVNINTTNFINILINNGASVIAPGNLNVQGNFTNNGSFTAGAGTVSFTGANVARILSGTSNTQFFNLILNKTNGGVSLAVSSPQTITNSLALTDGILDNPTNNLSISSGASVSKSSDASVATSALSGGPYHLTYFGVTQPTGFEIPASGVLNSLTISVNNASSVILGQAITVQNAFSNANAGRTFTSGANNVSLGSFSNTGTFNAPTALASTGLTVSGNFANNGLFNNNNGLTTFSGTTSLSGSSFTTFGRITISGTLSPLVNFALNGHFTNNGTFSSGNTTVTFSGTTLQNITGSTPLTTFQNITITNGTSPTSVSIESNVNLIGIMTLGASAKLDADGSANAAVLTLLSTSDSPAADASIAALPPSAQVNGDVTVQRFFRPADNFDRFISSPVSSATVAQLQASTPAESVPITGGFTGTSFPCTGCVNDGHNLRYYREATPGIINNGYQAWVTSTSSTLVPGVGYDLYMWNGLFNTTVSMRGTINRGSINLGIVSGPPSNSITHTNNGSPSADGWNLVGNPYPSAIQWNNGAGWTRTNIDPTVWVWDVVGRVWHSYNANTSLGDLTNGIIASGQGFWVYAPSPGAASIIVNEQAKSIAGSGAYYRQRDEPATAIRISLTHNGVSDHAYMIADKMATSGYDLGIEAIKLQLGIEQVSVSIIDSDRRKLAHYALGELSEDMVQLYVYGERDGDYELGFEALNGFPDFDSYYLIDTYLGESFPIASAKQYAFAMTQFPETLNERFYLSKSPLAEKPRGEMNLNFYPNPVSNILTVEVPRESVELISLIDNSGREVYQAVPYWTGSVSRVSMDVTNNPSGLYVIKVISDGKLQTRRVLIVH